MSFGLLTQKTKTLLLCFLLLLFWWYWGFNSGLALVRQVLYHLSHSAVSHHHPNQKKILVLEEKFHKWARKYIPVCSQQKKNVFRKQSKYNCISQGSPEKQNQGDVYINRKIYFKELTYMIWKLASPKSAGWTSRLENKEVSMLKFKFKFKSHVLVEFPVALSGS
jgi:hypothetical protein